MKSRITTAAIGAVAIAALAGCSSTSGAPAASGEAEGAFEPSDVRMIVPFAAGGGSDVSGRAIASGLEEATGATITVENREGGSGAVGYSHFLAQEGNGNYLLASETALLALPLTTDVDFTYESFTPIMKLGDDYTLVVVPGDSEFQTCTDVVDAARADGVVVAVSGAVSLDEVVFTLIEQDQDVEFDRVPFEGGSEVIAGLLGGTVEVGSLNPSEVLGQLESGDLRALCALSEDRYEYEQIADIPTATEQGIDVAFAQWRGFIAPGGISDEARDYWTAAAEEFAASEAYTAYIEENLMQPNALYGDEFVEYLAENSAELEAVVGQ
ncbi:tripartite tricarboxylate transporter substrate binding protein [Agrococcus sp. BE272]|jgi:putative tricarboxylic transport membrane protein|uniref:tripartite tricarboxylate transporter substrate binding protein n=1 Tax=Agrococcus sp. BE272 TaxID=2817727 RepID=UPI0028551E0E|nr:tripartite tricarboxylate transporter substrate binding protein [Agrococcus sp. BE272]MDR7233070.1 putative tricarboxylic transport membrane protein [Agrococcus sp. BE272]